MEGYLDLDPKHEKVTNRIIKLIFFLLSFISFFFYLFTKP